jgi:hypothetical protein
MAAPPENRMLMTLYRSTDKKPPLLELSDIEAIAALPEFKSQQGKSRRVSQALAL